MPRIICLTGGIGSGKSTVAEIFRANGFPVYLADEAGRRMLERRDVLDNVVSVFGPEIVQNGILDRKALAAMVFNDKSKLSMLNEIVHPAVADDFQHWIAENSKSEFVVRETAILFESGTQNACDIIVTVSAPLEMRVERVIRRDGSTRDEVMRRIANQLTDAEREAKSHFTLVNIDQALLEPQINEFLKKLQNL